MIQFIVEMEILKKHINFVRSGLGNTRTDLSALLFRFEVNGEKVVIFAADKEMFCRTEMVVKRPEGEQPFVAFAVLGSKMEALVAQVAAEKVTFIVDAENLEIQAGFLTVNFETYDSTALRTVETGVEEHLTMESQTPVLRELLAEAVSCAKACSTTDSLRPDVNHSEMRKSRLLSSDGRKIMIFSSPGLGKEVQLKLPNTSLNSVVTSLKNMEAEAVHVIEGKSYFYIKTGGNRFSFGVRKVERSFPLIEEQITKIEGSDDEVSIDKNVLISMCRGVSLGLSGDEVRVEVTLRGTGKDAVLEIEGSNKIGKRSHECASCGRRAIETIAVPVSFKHVLDTLSVFKGDSVVDMVLIQKRKVLLVRDKTNDREVLTVIPFRTTEQIQEEKKELEKKDTTAKPVTATIQGQAEPALEQTAAVLD